MAGRQPTAHVAPGGTPATVASTPTLKTLPFPAPSANPFTGPPTAQTKLQNALNAAIASGPGAGWRVPVCVVALPNRDGSGPPCVFAAARGNENHYTASLAKVHAMYAAFQLRETLRAIAAELGPSATISSVIPSAAKFLNPLIMQQAGAILASATLDPRSKHPVTLANKLPSYAGFEAVRASSGVTVNFSSDYQTSLEKMIQVSSDTDAQKVVHTIGYGYLNGALASARFFDPSTQTGLWLAGDYSFFKDWGALTIDTVNDAKASAVATVFQLARMFTLLHRFGGLFFTGSVADQPDPADPTGTANGRCRIEMMRLLQGAGSWMRGLTPPVGFTVLGDKLGLGNLKDNVTQVLSEAAFIKHTASGRLFVVAWQNLVGDANIVAQVIDRTLTGFLPP